MDIFGRKRKRREAAEVAYNEAVRQFEIDQTWRMPAMETKNDRNPIAAVLAQRKITLDAPYQLNEVVVHKGSGIHKVVKQGPGREPKPRVIKLVTDRSQRVHVVIDKSLLTGYVDQAKAYVHDPLTLAHLVRNRAEARYRDYLYRKDAALFV